MLTWKHVCKCFPLFESQTASEWIQAAGVHGALTLPPTEAHSIGETASACSEPTQTKLTSSMTRTWEYRWRLHQTQGELQEFPTENLLLLVFYWFSRLSCQRLSFFPPAAPPNKWTSAVDRSLSETAQRIREIC